VAAEREEAWHGPCRYEVNCSPRGEEAEAFSWQQHSVYIVVAGSESGTGNPVRGGIRSGVAERCACICGGGEKRHPSVVVTAVNVSMVLRGSAV